MKLEENKAIVRKLIDAMDRGDLSILDEVCAFEGPPKTVHLILMSLSSLLTGL